MKPSNLLSADLAPPLKNATAASSSKGASVTNNTVTESTSADKSTDKSIQTDRFSSEYEAAVKGDKTPSAEMMKKSSNDDLVEKNQSVDLKSQLDGTHVLEVKGNKEVSLDGENTAASDVVSVTDVLVSDASVINGTEQKIPVDTESKQQVMAEGEELLNQLSVSNKQLAAPSEQDGKLLPPKTSNLDGQKNGNNVEVELPTSGLLTQNTILQQKNNPSTIKEQLTEIQESGGLSEGELAKVFASSSVNNDSQQIDSSGLSSNNMLDKPDVADDANIGEGKIDNAKISTSVVATSGAVTETESEDMDASSPDSGQLAMAGALVMPSNEQAVSAVKKASPSVQADITLSIPWSTSASIPSSAATVSAGAAASPLVASPTEAVASHSMMGIGMAGAAALITSSDNTDGTQTKEINSAVGNAGLVTGMDSALNNTPPNTDNKASDFSQQLNSLSGQQSGLNMQAKSEALAQAQSPLQLSKEQAGDQVSERINMMMSKNLKHVDIRLDPPELGKLQIRLSLNQDQASVQFTVGNQQTRDLVEHSMPRLREMLHQQGLQLAQSSVQQDTSRQAFSGQSGQQNQNDSGAQQSGNNSGNGSHAGGNNHDDNVMSGGETVDMYVKPADDRVDYYA
jgi:flagellar hook-length control protein FliK